MCGLWLGEIVVWLFMLHTNEIIVWERKTNGNLSQIGDSDTVLHHILL